MQDHEVAHVLELRIQLRVVLVDGASGDDLREVLKKVGNPALDEVDQVVMQQQHWDTLTVCAQELMATIPAILGQLTSLWIF